MSLKRKSYNGSMKRSPNSILTFRNCNRSSILSINSNTSSRIMNSSHCQTRTINGNSYKMQRAKIVLSGQDHHEQDLLFHYREYIFEHLTPARFNDDDHRLTNFRKIDLDSKYKEAETVGREHLKSMFDEYRRRQHPNIDLIKEMIQIGMEQMTKRPRTDDFYRVSMSSNTLQKMFFILKSKNAYFMSLKNIADDFMVSHTRELRDLHRRRYF